MESKDKRKKRLIAVIIDDEEKSRRILHKIVEEYCKDVQIAATAKDVLSGIKAINDFNPDLVFLDIEMPNYSGFNLIEYFGEPTFEVVFTTAYDQYALKGIKASAAGYLLKPIDIDQLIEVVEKVRSICVQKEADKSLNAGLLTENINRKRIVFPAKNGMIYLNLFEICHLKSDRRYTRIFLTNGNELLSTKGLKDCMALLEGYTFLQIHRSVIINVIYLKKYARGSDSYVTMDNDVKLDVGKNFKEELSKVISLFY